VISGRDAKLSEFHESLDQSLDRFVGLLIKVMVWWYDRLYNLQPWMLFQWKTLLSRPIVNSSKVKPTPTIVYISFFPLSRIRYRPTLSALKDIRTSFHPTKLNYKEDHFIPRYLFRSVY